MSKIVICKDIEGKEHEVKISDLSFRPSAYACVIQDGKVLVSPQFDGYDFPGGAIDIGETIDQALKREVKEETGMTLVQKGALLDHREEFFMHPNGNAYHTLLLCYLGVGVGVEGEISTENFAQYEKQYAQAARWLDLDEAMNAKWINPFDSPAIIASAIKMLMG